MSRPFFLPSASTRVDTTGLSTYVDSMTEATDLAAAAGSTDPRVGLRAVVALRRLLEGLERLQVANARRKGWSWQEIADALEVTRQGVHKKHAHLMPAHDPREG
jgi:hypothetical protein